MCVCASASSNVSNEGIIILDRVFKSESDAPRSWLSLVAYSEEALRVSVDRICCCCSLVKFFKVGFQQSDDLRCTLHTFCLMSSDAKKHITDNL